MRRQRNEIARRAWCVGVMLLSTVLAYAASVQPATAQTTEQGGAAAPPRHRPSLGATDAEPRHGGRNQPHERSFAAKRADQSS